MNSRHTLKTLFCLGVICLSGLCISLSAQTTATPVTVNDLPYFEGFEDQTQAAIDWKLNNVLLPPMINQIADHWFLSTASSYQGKGCLLVSDAKEGGKSSTYSGKRCWTVAYREFDLPVGNYTLRFAWRCKGEDRLKTSNGITSSPRTSADGFYVGWLPQNTNILSGSTGGVDAELLKSHKKLRETKYPGEEDYKYNGSQFWKLEELTLNVPVAGIYRLYYVWDNDGDDYSLMYGPAVNIDNVQLDKQTAACPAPTALNAAVNNLDVTLTWQGNAAEYEVSYRSYGDTQTKYVRPNPKTNSCKITNMRQGLYDFFVRSICGAGDTSMYTTLNEIQVIDRSKRCIHFEDLYNAKCGHAKKMGGDNYQKLNFQERPGGWDFGSESEESYHTMHTHPGEVDPRTGGNLETIPVGELEAVRLGGWQTEGNAQYITYKYSVPTGANQVFMLRYAVVLEAPFDGTHNTQVNGVFTDMPRFTMELLNNKGNLLDADCGFADFYATITDPTWKQVKDANEQVTVYKPWTAVGIDLSKYAGQTLNIKFSTYDCMLEGHFGYAYFTLSCEETSGLSGRMCGNEQKATVEAPSGFDYEWFRPDNTTLNSPTPTPDSRDRVYDIVNPVVGTYTCNLISQVNNSCVSTITIDLRPRQPKTIFVPQYRPKDCKNIYEFTNSSQIMVDGKLTGADCNYYEWDFGDGSEVSYDKSPTHEFPATGGTYTIRLLSAIDDNSCTDTRDTTIIVPDITQNEIVIDTIQCSGKPYIYPGDPNKTPHTESEQFTVEGTNQAGCPVIAHINLTVIDQLSDTIREVICAGETYTYTDDNGKEWTYTFSGEFKLGAYTSENGCPGMRYLELTVLDALKLDTDIPEICADQTSFAVPFTIPSGAATACKVTFDATAKAAGFIDSYQDVTATELNIALPSTIKPDKYSAEVELQTERCGVFNFPLNFVVNYPKDIIVQKWNNVIALKNENYNGGGYTFTHYQWYKNGELIRGANLPYLYIGADATFNTTDTYSVDLVRTGENYNVSTCLLPIVVKNDVSDYVRLGTVAAVGQRITLSAPLPTCNAQWYTADGRLVGEYQVVDDNLTAPTTQGIYILHLIFDTEIRNYKIVVQ